MSTAGVAAAWIDRIVAEIPMAQDAAIQAALEQLVDQVRPVTPVRSGLMRDSYAVEPVLAGVEYELVNLAESPGGYPYPERVVFEPGFSRQYDALAQVLDAGIHALEREVELALTQVITRP